MAEQVDHVKEAEELEVLDDPKAAPTAVVGAIGVIVVVLSIIATAALYYYDHWRDYEKKVLSGAPPTITKIRADQARELYGPARWVDRSKNIVAIPIDQAMKLIVDEQLSKQPATSQPATITPAGSAPSAPPAGGGTGQKP